MKRATLIGPKCKGGLSMCDFSLQSKALKINMLKRLLDSDKAKWKILPTMFLKGQENNWLLLNVNTAIADKLSGWDIPKYYQQSISAWHSCKRDTIKTPKTAAEIRGQIIWGNKWIQCKKTPLFFSKWIKNNIIYVNDLFGRNGAFKESRIMNMLNYGNILRDLFIVKNSIPTEWKRILREYPMDIKVGNSSHNCILMKQQKGGSILHKLPQGRCIKYY